MFQTDMFIDRAAYAAPRDDDDALLDSWLASMSASELEFVLDRLATLDVPTRLEASA